MAAPRKSYTPTFTAEVVQELLKEEQTLTQIASNHGVHPNQLRRWRDTAVAAMPASMTDEAQYQKRLAALVTAHEKEKEQLYAEIGRLTTQLNWVKKKAKTIGVTLDAEESSRSRRA